MNTVEINKELIKLVSENPELPIYAWVDSEIVCGDGFWIGKAIYVKVSDVLFGWFERTFDDKDEFKEYYFDYYNEDFEELSDEEIEKKLNEICEAQNWIKAILITVSL